MLGGSIAGGVVLLAYLATMVASFRARRRVRARPASRAWLGIAVSLAALALDKAAHAERFLLAALDRRAVAAGWYAVREGAQVRAIAALAAAGLCAVAVIGWWLRRADGATRAAASTAALLVAFVLIRAVSLHGIDGMLATAVGPLSVSNIVELIGLAIIGFCALEIGRRRR